jgi:hypothetical protein
MISITKPIAQSAIVPGPGLVIDGMVYSFLVDKEWGLSLRPSLRPRARSILPPRSTGELAQGLQIGAAKAMDHAFHAALHVAELDL